MNRVKSFESSEILILVLVVLFCGLGSLILGRDLNYDLHSYHFYDGFAYLQGRLNQDVAPAGLQTYFNSTVDLFHYWGMTHLPSRIYGFLLGLLHGLIFPSL